MKLVGILLFQDLLVARTWFKKNTISRFFVAFAFLLICLLVSFFIYWLSKSFFIYLEEFDQFGRLTVEYLVAAAIIVTSWFAVVASLISIYGFLIQSSKETEYILTQPVSPKIIPVIYFIRTAVIDIFLFLAIFLPVIIAYQQIFLTRISLLFLIRFIFIILLLVLMLNSLSGWFAYKTVNWFRRPGPLSSLLMLMIFFGGLFGLLKIVFPNQIYLLLEADINQFFKIYYRLLLTQSWLPISWITSSILTGWSLDSVLFFLLVISLIIFSFPPQVFDFSNLYQNLHPKIHRHLTKQPISSFFWKYPFVFKDYLSIVRQPTEIGYLLFLLGIAFFFFLLLTLNVSFNNQFTSNWGQQLTVFSFIWLLFFVTAYSLRLIYPLMAREGGGRWYMFSLPISKKTILLEKLKFTLVLSLPLIIFSMVLWWVFPMTEFKLTLMIISLISIIGLSLINFLIGAISPDFDQSDYPEKVTTSGMGIVSLLISFVYTATIGVFLWFRLKTEINQLVLISFVLVLTITLLISGYSLVLRQLNKYQL